MKEMLYEESASPKNASRESKFYIVFQVASIVFILLGVINLFIAVNVIGGGILATEEENKLRGTALAVTIGMWVLLVLAFVGPGILFFFLKRRFNVSYDYTFVEDELRITKVFNGRRRKHVITMKCDQMLQIGWADSDGFDRAMAGMQGKKPKVMTSNREPAEGKEFYFILYSSSVEKAVYVIECKQMMLEYLVLAAGRTKLVRK